VGGRIEREKRTKEEARAAPDEGKENRTVDGISSPTLDARQSSNAIAQDSRTCANTAWTSIKGRFGSTTRTTELSAAMTDNIERPANVSKEVTASSF
jgi:hypothetical protein